MSRKRYLLIGISVVLFGLLGVSAEGGVGVATVYPADASPVVSPDGNEVAYISRRGPTSAPDGTITNGAAQTALYLRELNTQGERRLTLSGLDLSRATWTPDSKQLIFPASRLQGETSNGVDLYRYDLPSNTLTDLTGGEGAADDRPLVSPDGALVAYLHMDYQQTSSEGPSGLWLMNINGTDKRALVPFASSAKAVQGWAFSGDSRSVYYILLNNQSWELHEIRIDGSSDQLLATNSYPIWNLQISPDGKWLSWVDGSADQKIVVAPVSSPATPFALVTSQDSLNAYAWSDASDAIAYAQAVHPILRDAAGNPLYDLYVKHLPGLQGADDGYRVTRNAFVVGDISWHGKLAFITEASGCLQGLATSEAAPDEVGPEPGFIRLTNDCHVNGTAAADRITGTPYRDIVQASAGNDQVSGGRGNDLIYGGAGNDSLDGGYGEDTLVGGTGNDILIGGFGRDVISGGPGHDVIYGGGANDVIYARDGTRDTIDCGETRGFKRDLDIVYADRNDEVASNCERVIRSR